MGTATNRAIVARVPGPSESARVSHGPRYWAEETGVPHSEQHPMLPRRSYPQPGHSPRHARLRRFCTARNRQSQMIGAAANTKPNAPQTHALAAVDSGGMGFHCWPASSQEILPSVPSLATSSTTYAQSMNPRSDSADAIVKSHRTQAILTQRGMATRRSDVNLPGIEASCRPTPRHEQREAAANCSSPAGFCIPAAEFCILCRR